MISGGRNQRWLSNLSDHRRALRLGAIVAAVLGEGIATWLRSGRMGGNLVVRCRRGHLFETIWIPGVSLKSLRLGWWRLQRCPVGHHWTVVIPVRESDLTDDAQRVAREHHDVRVP